MTNATGKGALGGKRKRTMLECATRDFKFSAPADLSHCLFKKSVVFVLKVNSSVHNVNSIAKSRGAIENKSVGTPVTPAGS